MYDFDRVIDRSGTCSVKFDLRKKNGYDDDVLPLWVADMDFPAPPCIQEALGKAVDFGIYGYSILGDDYFPALQDWFQTYFDWELQPEWLMNTPGVVFALATAVRATAEPGDRVLVQPPVYYPFYNVVRQNGRELVENPLIYKNGKYTIDFEDFEKKIAEKDVKLFILCSPHNPICRVWTKEELQKIGEICKKYNVTVISDEIHCDFAFPQHPHTPFPKACPDMADRCIVCTAPSKTFNIAGLQVSNIFIPGEELRERFRKEQDIMACHDSNYLGVVACNAAYRGGAQWLTECKAYMRENLSYVRDFLREHLPQIRLVEPEGTYFAWLDCTGLGLTKEELDDLILHKAKLWLDSGAIFGDCAAQFQRVVLACPRKTLEEAMCRLKKAVDSI